VPFLFRTGVIRRDSQLDERTSELVTAYGLHAHGEQRRTWANGTTSVSPLTVASLPSVSTFPTASQLPMLLLVCLNFTVITGAYLTRETVVIDHFSSNFTPKWDNGIFSITVGTPSYPLVAPRGGGPAPPGLLSELHSAGQLQNPVVGMRLGGDGDGKLDVGYLDEDSFEGSIDWLQAVDAQKAWNLPLALRIDELRGVQGRPINGTQGMLADFDSCATISSFFI
jgi:hypothetical protein